MSHFELEEGIMFSIIESASHLLTEIVFIFDESGLRIGQLSAHKSSMLFVGLDADEFNKFEGFFDGLELCVGLDVLSKLAKALRQGGKRMVKLCADWEQREATFEIFGHGSTKFKPPLLDSQLSSTKRKPTNLVFELSFDMVSNRLTHIIKNLSIGRRMKFIVKDGDFIMHSSEMGLGEIVDTIPLESDVFENVEFLKDTDEIVVQFRNDIFAEELKGLLKVSDSLHIQMATDKPIIISTKLGKKGELGILIAPFIERH